MNLNTEKKKKINETKTWFFEKINKINKPPIRLTTLKKRHKLHKSGMSHCDMVYIIRDPADIKRVTREYCTEPYTHEFDSLVEINQFF